MTRTPKQDDEITKDPKFIWGEGDVKIERRSVPVDPDPLEDGKPVRL